MTSDVDYGLFNLSKVMTRAVARDRSFFKATALIRFSTRSMVISY